LADNSIYAAGTQAGKEGEIIMRTIIIYDQLGGDDIKFIILPGNYKHFNRVYINATEKEKEWHELSDLLYDDTTGAEKVMLLDEFPELEPGDIVIVAGFLP
jgi:hypothetical protein